MIVTIQVSTIGKDWAGTPYTVHNTDNGSQLAQHIADATQREVRMTRPSEYAKNALKVLRDIPDVSRFNGRYFSPSQVRRHNVEMV